MPAAKPRVTSFNGSALVTTMTSAGLAYCPDLSRAKIANVYLVLAASRVTRSVLAGRDTLPASLPALGPAGATAPAAIRTTTPVTVVPDGHRQDSVTAESVTAPAATCVTGCTVCTDAGVIGDCVAAPARPVAETDRKPTTLANTASNAKP